MWSVQRPSVPHAVLAGRLYRPSRPSKHSARRPLVPVSVLVARPRPCRALAPPWHLTHLRSMLPRILPGRPTRPAVYHSGGGCCVRQSGPACIGLGGHWFRYRFRRRVQALACHWRHLAFDTPCKQTHGPEVSVAYGYRAAPFAVWASAMATPLHQMFATSACISAWTSPPREPRGGRLASKTTSEVGLAGPATCGPGAALLPIRVVLPAVSAQRRPRWMGRSSPLHVDSARTHPPQRWSKTAQPQPLRLPRLQLRWWRHVLATLHQLHVDRLLFLHFGPSPDHTLVDQRASTLLCRRTTKSSTERGRDQDRAKSDSGARSHGGSTGHEL